MKSASSAASGSGQQHVQRSATDVEAESPTVAQRHEKDHHHEKAMRVEQVESGSIMELPVSIMCSKWARQSKHSD